MAKNTYDSVRSAIPAEVRRAVEVASGHSCIVRHCGEHTYLEIHHIDANRENNAIDNLALLCDKHHKMAHSEVIDRKALREYNAIRSEKRLLSKESLEQLLAEIFEPSVASDLISGQRESAHVVLNPATVEELAPYMTNGLLMLKPNHSLCSMGAGNRVGNEFEDHKRPYGIGSGFFLSCVCKG